MKLISDPVVKPGQDRKHIWKRKQQKEDQNHTAGDKAGITGTLSVFQIIEKQAGECDECSVDQRIYDSMPQIILKRMQEFLLHGSSLMAHHFGHRIVEGSRSGAGRDDRYGKDEPHKACEDQVSCILKFTDDRIVKINAFHNQCSALNSGIDLSLDEVFLQEEVEHDQRQHTDDRIRGSLTVVVHDRTKESLDDQGDGCHALLLQEVV